MAGLKKGKLTDKEQAFIKENIANYSPRQIALHLNRSEKLVGDFLEANKIAGGTKVVQITVDEDMDLKERLMGRPYYNEVFKQLSKEELSYFMETWIRIIKQFREDVYYTEELQVKQWITLEIQSNRVLEDRRKSMEQIERMEEMLNQEKIKPPGLQDVNQMAALESDISMIRNSMSNYTSEHVKILDKIDAITKNLKAARSDRVKKIEDSKTSFTGFLKALEDPDIRVRVGEDAEIQRMAKDKVADKLAQYHTYADGLVDQPLLTPDTVKEQENVE